MRAPVAVASINSIGIKPKVGITISGFTINVLAHISTQTDIISMSVSHKKIKKTNFAFLEIVSFAISAMEAPLCLTDMISAERVVNTAYNDSTDHNP